MGSSIWQMLGQAEIRRSRPGRLSVVAVNLLVLGAACTYVLLGFALALIFGGLVTNPNLFRMGLGFLAASPLGPVVAVFVIYNLFLARRWAWVGALLMSLVAPAFEFWVWLLAQRGGGPPRDFLGVLLVLHLVTVLSVLSIPILLSPATLRWVARSRGVALRRSVSERLDGTSL